MSRVSSQLKTQAKPKVQRFNGLSWSSLLIFLVPTLLIYGTFVLYPARQRSFLELFRMGRHLA